MQAGNVPPGPILKGGKKSIRRHTRKRRKPLPKAPPGTVWPKGSIAYICGACPVKFGPNDKALGGSEQAVVQLSKCWAAAGYQVVVFGNVKTCKEDGVEYRDIHEINLADTFDTAIFWRSYGVRLLPIVLARKKIVDLHDSWDPKNYVSPSQLIDNVDVFMVKSEYHKGLYDYIPRNMIKVIMNGVQTDLFTKIKSEVSESTREPHRLIYASMYDRGLEPILKYTWPKIKAAIPDAEFDIYYGIGSIEKTPLGKKLLQHFKQPGVKEHGRVSLDVVAEQKCKSAIHLYVSNSATEIDCISVRESLLCGSVPVLGNDYVFKERDGVHVKGSTDNPETYKRAATKVIRLLKDQAELQRLRDSLYKSKTVIPWDQVASEWLKIIA